MAQAAASGDGGYHFAPKAKRAIYLFMSGAPSQIDLYDPKPKMAEWYDKDLPDSIRQGQRLTTMTSGQKRFPIAPSIYQFDKHGESGMEISEMLPNIAKMTDDIAFGFARCTPKRSIMIRRSPTSRRGARFRAVPVSGPGSVTDSAV